MALERQHIKLPYDLQAEDQDSPVSRNNTDHRHHGVTNIAAGYLIRPKTTASLAHHHHHHHHHTGQRGLGKPMVSHLDRPRAMLEVAETLAGRTGHPLTGHAHECRQEVHLQEEHEHKLTLTFRVTVMMDLEAGIKVNEETRGGKGAVW